MNVNEKETTLTRAGSAATRKLVLTAMFTCLAFVLNTFVYFPAMAPFQHFVNVLAAALVGPWYGIPAPSATGTGADQPGRAQAMQLSGRFLCATKSSYVS